MEYDLAIIGGGVAGLSATRRAQELGISAVVIDRHGPGFRGATTHYAQGGLAVVGLPDQPVADSVALHAEDTVRAGAFHNNVPNTEDILAAAADAVTWLIGNGAEFDKTDGIYNRTLEGGHSRRRIIHANGDATGAEVERALIAATRTAEILKADALAITPTGVLTSAGPIQARNVLVATGGCGQLYEATTAPRGATGEGMALAFDAGAPLKDMEFIQFHPTVLNTPGTGQKPLITEALRGEGAHLVDRAGNRLTDDDLAPRDVVSREIWGREAFLDARSIPDVTRRFPTVAKGAATIGLDPAQDLLPVAPAAHYTCGGINADAHGRTGITGLYAAGECSRTGLHGANRLASNSLLEGLVVGKRVAEDVASGGFEGKPRRQAKERPQLSDAEWTILRNAMTRGVGLVRTFDGLIAALEVIEGLPEAGAVVVAKQIALAALRRTQTLGCHTRG
ncbi:L-aspartate oxidase [Corynebacterium kalinowskii]|uniref:L-aspartate oxidase n=1 Tax=Corynebacterium kalinowskii TaxID=2675216 RepID=A0A6B8VZL7_9CORY|nr:FAD-binding protein [Corynebacterium kalinowskii]QGU00998.1 L-aspartate oxidase [Corynebacterium kalinowskii]